MKGSEGEGRVVRRGDVYLLDVSREGGRLTKERPVLVVQNDVGNLRSSETIVLAIRDPHGGRTLPIFVPVARGEGGLRKNSIVDAGHTITVGKDRLGGRLGVLPPDVMAQVNHSLRISLDLI